MSGLRTIDDLRDRCRIDDITGCWHWAGARSGGAPSTRVPGLGRNTSLGKAIGYLLTGREPGRGVVWHATCETRGCCNPAHRRAGTRQTQMLAIGRTLTSLERARIARGCRRVLTAEAVGDIRDSSEPLRVLAERHGCAISTAARVRRGERWRESGFSVFSRWEKAA